MTTGGTGTIPVSLIIRLSPVPQAGDGVGDRAQVQVLAQHDQHHGKEDKDDTDHKTGRERLAKDQHSDGYRGERFQGSQDGRGCRPDMVDGKT